MNPFSAGGETLPPPPVRDIVYILSPSFILGVDSVDELRA